MSLDRYLVPFKIVLNKSSRVCCLGGETVRREEVKHGATAHLLRRLI